MNFFALLLAGSHVTAIGPLSFAECDAITEVAVASRQAQVGACLGEGIVAEQLQLIRCVPDAQPAEYRPGVSLTTYRCGVTT